MLFVLAPVIILLPSKICALPGEARKARASVAASKMSFECFHQICNCHLPAQRSLLEPEQSPLQKQVIAQLRVSSDEGKGQKLVTPLEKSFPLKRGSVKALEMPPSPLGVCVRNGISSLLFLTLAPQQLKLSCPCQLRSRTRV